MSIMPLCTFTDAGIQAFRECLAQMKARKIVDLPADLLTDPLFSRPVDEPLQVELHHFATTRDLVQYLHPFVTTLSLPDKFYNPGLWAWLSAFYFELVCPKEHGWRNPREDVRHILPANREWNRVYRHLIAAPMRLFDAHGGDRTYPFLYTPPHQRSDLLNQLMAVQALAMNPSILDAVRLLYWDEAHHRPKRGTADKRDKPGTLRRFITVINQFNLTFDLFAMSGEQIVKLLPEREFGRWLKARS